MKTKNVMVYFFISSFFFLSVMLSCVAAETEYQGNFQAEGYSLSWKGDANKIHFTISAKTAGWVAIGFQPSKQMKDADMILAYFDSISKKGTIRDCFSVGENGPHPEDTALGGQNNIETFFIAENDGVTVVEFDRPLNTGDRFDKVIDPDKEMTIIWAFGEDDNAEMIHADKGIASVHWSKNKVNQRAASGSRGRPVHFYLMGAGLLVTAFGIWFTKHKMSYQKRLKTHSILVSIALILFFLGFFLQFIWLQITLRAHFTVFHAWVGLVSLFSMLVTLLLAALYFRRKSMSLRNSHVSVGIAASVLALTATILGKFLILNLF